MDEQTLEVAGAALHVTAAGSGPAIVVVHGLASDASAWAPALDRFAAAGRRGVAYDRRGYGGSTAPVPYTGTTVEEQAEDLAAVLRDTTPAHPATLLGDGFGALVVLDVVKRHRGLVAAAVLAHPPLFAFVPAATEVLSAQRAELSEAMREGGPGLAVERWLGDRVDAVALARARAAAPAFFADFAGLSSWPVTRRELRGLDVPAIIATHPMAPPHILAAADALAALLPDARREPDGSDLAGLALVL